MIPQQISHQDVIDALDEIDQMTEIDPRRQSTRYHLTHRNRKYPPKYAVSLAAKYCKAVRRELAPGEFSGGAETNNFLTNLGFAIQKGGTKE